jgi:hypothetical protein
MCSDPESSSKTERFDSEPCPWCNEHPRLRHAYDQGGTWYQVFCANKSCPIKPTSQWGGKLEVIKSWNEPLRVCRAPLPLFTIGLHGCP